MNDQLTDEDKLKWTQLLVREIRAAVEVVNSNAAQLYNLGVTVEVDTIPFTIATLGPDHGAQFNQFGVKASKTIIL